jgi:hypothetical protein
MSQPTNSPRRRSHHHLPVCRRVSYYSRWKAAIVGRRQVSVVRFSRCARGPRRAVRFCVTRLTQGHALGPHCRLHIPDCSSVNGAVGTFLTQRAARRAIERRRAHARGHTESLWLTSRSRACVWPMRAQPSSFRGRGAGGGYADIQSRTYQNDANRTRRRNDEGASGTSDPWSKGVFG